MSIRHKTGMPRLIPDDTGLSSAKCSERICEAHKAKHGFIMLGMMINHDTHEILAFRATDEHIVDSPRFE